MSHPELGGFTLLPDPDAPGTGPYTAAAFSRMLKALLPPGKAWRLDPDSNLSKLFLACGDELERIDGRCRDLLEEADPSTADELLEDYERVLGLEATGTDDERRARVVAWLLRRQRYRPADFRQVLAPVLGLDPEDVVVIEQDRAFAVSVSDDREIYRFYIYRNPALGGTYDLEAAQAIVDTMKPAHTVGHVVDFLDFLCDDVNSLCDQHRLGV